MVTMAFYKGGSRSFEEVRQPGGGLGQLRGGVFLQGGYIPLMEDDHAIALTGKRGLWQLPRQNSAGIGYDAERLAKLAAERRLPVIPKMRPCDSRTRIQVVVRESRAAYPGLGLG